MTDTVLDVAERVFEANEVYTVVNVNRDGITDANFLDVSYDGDHTISGENFMIFKGIIEQLIEHGLIICGVMDDDGLRGDRRIWIGEITVEPDEAGLNFGYE